MLLSVNNMEFSYKDMKILKGIDFTVEEGDFVSILGINGSGKSTLLKCINKILNYESGSISLNDEDIKNIDNFKIAQKIAYVPQKFSVERSTVFDAILLGRRPYITWNVSEKDIEITKNMMKLLNINSYALRYINELSGGELQKVVLARALVQDPEILLLDEPTSDLDLKNQYDVMNLLKTIAKDKKITPIIVLHDINLALRYSNKFILLKDGKVFSCGGEDIINVNTIKEVYGIDAYVKDINGIKTVIPKPY
ncbi:iron complex transport system ATP-binding protein [Methanobrevibacter olleyae]|uniref:Iron ABC transporter ATP-binding protein n=2 Tax=Methanobrevibacter olleyae TaxID=294671 RepID=A0A126R0T4_METOL|nr:ABC transporter ATP-binding protein [Methanobrevibacter olleyae]AMK15901.1 iron ABC transporter ATP-binding protein [Methanobrevibacter olleyae]SFL15022.1 iron complex transport system ATP-binding protein [Methanobrevibacter olleyae]